MPTKPCHSNMQWELYSHQVSSLGGQYHYQFPSRAHASEEKIKMPPWDFPHWIIPLFHLIIPVGGQNQLLYVTGYWGYCQMLLVLEDQLILMEAPLKIEEQDQVLLQWESVCNCFCEKRYINVQGRRANLNWSAGRPGSTSRSTGSPDLLFPLPIKQACSAILIFKIRCPWTKDGSSSGMSLTLIFETQIYTWAVIPWSHRMQTDTEQWSVVSRGLQEWFVN